MSHEKEEHDNILKLEISSAKFVIRAQFRTIIPHVSPLNLRLCCSNRSTICQAQSPLPLEVLAWKNDALELVQQSLDNQAEIACWVN